MTAQGHPMTAPDVDEAVERARYLTDEYDLNSNYDGDSGDCLNIARALLAQVAENKRLHASRDAEAKVVEAAVALFLDAKETYAYADDPGYSANRIKRDLSAVDDLIRLRAGKERP